MDDAIIPKQFLKTVGNTSLGYFLFDAWCYVDACVQPGEDCRSRPLNPDFVSNQPRYRGTSILLTRENFGCGSSREHAVWAMANLGFRLIVDSQASTLITPTAERIPFEVVPRIRQRLLHGFDNTGVTRMECGADSRLRRAPSTGRPPGCSSTSRGNCTAQRAPCVGSRADLSRVELSRLARST